jgi:hypothetical protein
MTRRRLNVKAALAVGRCPRAPAGTTRGYVSVLHWRSPAVSLARAPGPVPQRIESSLAAGIRSVLVFPDQRVWWDATVLESNRRCEFRWPWPPGETWETTVSVLLEPAGYGTLLTLTDGPFDLRVPGVLDAYAEALEGWGEALAWLRGVADFSSDLRPRPY